MVKIFPCRNRRVALFCVFMNLIFCAWAKSDISVKAMTSFNHTDYRYRGNFYHSVSDTNFGAGISNYNCPFKIENIGFFEGISLEFLKEFSVDAFAGAAFFVPLNGWLSMKGGPALLFRYADRNYNSSDTVQFSLGILNEFCLKFIPTRRFSCELGMDISFNFWCYQIEKTESYISYWNLEDYGSFYLKPFMGFSVNL